MLYSSTVIQPVTGAGFLLIILNFSQPKETIISSFGRTYHGGLIPHVPCSSLQFLKLWVVQLIMNWYMDAISVLITLCLLAGRVLDGCCRGGLPMRDGWWGGSPTSWGQNIPGDGSTMSWWMVEIGYSAIWTWFHSMINLSRGRWLCNMKSLILKIRFIMDLPLCR